MAEIVWSEVAWRDLDEIAEYVALDKPAAAKELVQRVMAHVEQLADFPLSGTVPKELRGSRYRQVVEPPCRIFYRVDSQVVVIVHVVRSEQRLRRTRLKRRSRSD